MDEEGLGDNPLWLKRKLRLGGAERNVIFSPPESEYRYKVRLNRKSVLEFGIGIVRDAHSERMNVQEKDNDGGVNFLVKIEMKGREKTVFQRYLSLPEYRGDSTFEFSRHTINLPYETDEARLSFITQGKQRYFSYWANPVLYKKGEKTRNVILISVDTLRADHLGCYGYSKKTSPNIDALAEDSALFYNVYASSPWTLPSHISLLTGLHGVHHQVYYDDEKMDPNITTLADVFRTNDYSCAAFTGGGFVSTVYGFAKGFDSYNEGVGGVYHQDSAERVYQAVSEWIDRYWDRDFFLFIHTYQPHTPYICPWPYRRMFLNELDKLKHVDLISHLGGKSGIFKRLPDEERKNIIGLYDGEIRYTDEKLVGPLLTKLKETGLYQETMIVFTSDHGEEFYDHGGWAHGHSVYDESIKVPLIIKFPGSRFRGKRSENIVSLVDVMPTILEEMILERSGMDIDGQSLITILIEEEKGNRRFLADLGNNVLNSRIPKKISTNQGKNKLILSQRFSPADLDFFTSPPPKTGPIELYDLGSDPGEQINLADAQLRLSNQIIKWIDDFYSKAKKRKPNKAEVDENIREQLKALGYIR
jgi:arylsulfatase A-like enzyme